VVRASGYRCLCRISPGFDPSILRHSGIRAAADEAVLNNVHTKKKCKKSPFIIEYWTFKNVIYRSAEEQLLKLRKYEYQMFLDNKLPPPFSSARAQAARYSAGIFKQSMGARNRLGIGLSYQTTPPGYTARRNRFLGIDSWPP
jgi:hypothetical protein